MAADSERMRLIIEARETASAEIRRLRSELNSLGGAPMVKAQNEIKKLNRNIKQLSATGKKGPAIWTRFTQGIAIGNIAAQGAIRAFDALRRAVSGAVSTMVQEAMDWEASMASIRSVSETTGRDFNAIMQAMQSQMGGLASKTSIASGFLKGLTTTLTVDQLNQMTTAIKNATIAMGEDFNTQLPLIIKAIKQLNPAILDNIGVTVRLDQVNKRIREGYYGMGTAINESTQQHAIFVEIMKQTAQYAGQEEVYLDTLTGQWTTFKVATTDALTDISTELLAAFGGDAKQALSDMTQKLKDFATESKAVAGVIVGTTRVVTNAFQIMWNAVSVVLSPIIDNFRALGKGVTFVKGTLVPMPDAFANMAKEANAVNKQINDLVDALDQLETGLADLSAPQAIVAPEAIIPDTAGQVEEANKKLVEAAHIPEPLEDEWVDMEVGAIESMGRVEAHISAFQRQVASSTMRMGSSMVNAFMQGRLQAGQIFKGMAADFMNFFVQKALASVLTMFIPGLGGLLGGIFDTPKYDKLAMQQGEHFAKFFTQGAMRGMSGIGPVMAYAGAAQQGRMQTGGGPTYNVHITGNVMSERFTEETVVPALQRLSVRNRAEVALKSRNATGDADVRLN